MRMNVQIALVLIGFINVLAACADSETSEEASRKRCIALREHLIDLRLSSAAASVDVKAHRDAMQRALGDKFVDECQQHASVTELKCQLSANDLETATACRSK
jgi:hypothetical protein